MRALRVGVPAAASLGSAVAFVGVPVRTLGGALAVAGALCFAGNMTATVVRHGRIAALGRFASAGEAPER